MTPAERTTRRNDRRRRAFSLVELMIVVALLALLLGILMPSLMRVRDYSSAAEVAQRIRQIDEALRAYQQDNRIFPLQDRLDEINGDASELLAEVLYPTTADALNAKPTYFPDQQEGDVLNGAVSDQAGRDPRPILYFPADMRVRRHRDQYNLDHNSDYLGGPNGGWGSQDAFRAWITDGRLGNEVPFNPDEFLLIAPGIDRRYGTDDDVTNFQRGQ